MTRGSHARPQSPRVIVMLCATHQTATAFIRMLIPEQALYGTSYPHACHSLEVNCPMLTLHNYVCSSLASSWNISWKQHIKKTQLQSRSSTGLVQPPVASMLHSPCGVLIFWGLANCSAPSKGHTHVKQRFILASLQGSGPGLRKGC